MSSPVPLVLRVEILLDPEGWSSTYGETPSPENVRRYVENLLQQSPPSTEGGFMSVSVPRAGRGVRASNGRAPRG